MPSEYPCVSRQLLIFYAWKFLSKARLQSTPTGKARLESTPTGIGIGIGIGGGQAPALRYGGTAVQRA